LNTVGLEIEFRLYLEGGLWDRRHNYVVYTTITGCSGMGDRPTFDEITLEMSDDGALVLSKIKDDLADGQISLRHATHKVYEAMSLARFAGESGAASKTLFLMRLPLSVQEEMFRQQLHPGSSRSDEPKSI
jgi:hypothetical protein